MHSKSALKDPLSVLTWAVFIVGCWGVLAYVAPTSRVPSPTATATQIWHDRFDYLPHLAATLYSASLGFALAAGAAIVIAMLFLFVPLTRVLMGLLTFIYSIPLVLLIPIVGVQFSPDLTRIISAALIVYFPILLLVGLGLRNVPLSLLDVIASNGGGSWTVFKMLRVRYALAALVGGLQAAAPLAILGSMLGELTGARWGMGSYLLATMVQANPQKEWGVFIVCSALAALAYLAVGLLFRPLLSPFAVSDASSAELDAPSSKEYLRESHWTHGILSIVASLISWQIVAYWLNNPFFLKSPLQIVLYAIHLTLNQWSMVLTALTQTMEWAGFGLVVGVGAAVVLAAAFDLVPSLVPSLLPFAVLSQTVPIVALIPLVVSAFGRGFWATMVITVFATFFPSFVTLRQGLERTPPSFLDVLRASGATQHQLLFRVKLPNSVPFAYAALRLAAPKVLLGITMAEYFVTRRGLGSLMFEARGTLDFGMMWIIAVVTGVISLTLYELFHQLEVKRGAKYQTARASV